MNAKERHITAIRGQKPDHVPAVPDFWEMIPIRMSNKPSWEILLYQYPPRWKAMVDAYAYFGVDAFIPIVVSFSDDPKEAVVHKTDDKLIVRPFTELNGVKKWGDCVSVYTLSEPSAIVSAQSLNLGDDNENFKIVKSNFTLTGQKYYQHFTDYLGDNGLVVPILCLFALMGDCELFENIYTI